MRTGEKADRFALPPTAAIGLHLRHAGQCKCASYQRTMESDMIRSLSVEHHEYVTDRPFDEVLAAFNVATGSLEEGIGSVLQSIDNVAEFESDMKARESASGFMRFMVVNHGAWISRYYGMPSKAVMVVLGNPLIAITMLEHDVRAGLNVPTRLMIYEDVDARTRVVFDLPSTQMGNLPEAAQAAARKLDAKLIALANFITGSPSK